MKNNPSSFINSTVLKILQKPYFSQNIAKKEIKLRESVQD